MNPRPTPHREEEPTARVEIVREIAKWLRHVDRLDEINGARDLMPEKNPLWDVSFALEREFGQEPASPRVTSPEGSSEAEARVVQDDSTCSSCGAPVKPDTGRYHPDLGMIYGFELGLEESREPASPIQSPSPESARVEAEDVERLRQIIGSFEDAIDYWHQHQVPETAGQYADDARLLRRVVAALSTRAEATKCVAMLVETAEANDRSAEYGQREDDGADDWAARCRHRAEAFRDAASIAAVALSTRATTPTEQGAEQTRVLADGLVGLAEIVLEWWDSGEGEDGHEPDEADPICHLLSACYAIRDEPAHVQTHLYANFAPGEDQKPERKLIAAGHVLNALSARASTTQAEGTREETEGR